MTPGLKIAEHDFGAIFTMEEVRHVLDERLDGFMGSIQQCVMLAGMDKAAMVTFCREALADGGQDAVLDLLRSVGAFETWAAAQARVAEDVNERLLIAIADVIDLPDVVPLIRGADA
jgi:hypothetical protein